MEIIELFQKGGFVMYLLLLASICTIAILAERFMFYRKALKGIVPYTDNLEKILSGKSWEEIMQSSLIYNNVAVIMVNETAKAVLNGYDAELALDRTYTALAAQFRRGLNYLSAIVTLSPLGTIFGMINSFQIFNLQAGQPMAITGGIGEALTATAFGLIVAVFSLAVHTYFASRMDNALTIMEKTGAVLLSEVRKRG